MPNQPTPLIACQECDLLQREVIPPRGGSAHCRRCGALLYRNAPDCLDRTLAFTLAACVLFIIANLYPIVGIEIQGNRNASNLYCAVQALWGNEMKSVALLVGITTILIPASELAMLTYLLLPLKFRCVPAGIPLVLRVLQSIKPWGMVEVFMLGILVSLVKLSNSSTIIPGIALWSFGGLTLMLAAVAASFNPRDFWACWEKKSGGEMAQ